MEKKIDQLKSLDDMLSFAKNTGFKEKLQTELETKADENLSYTNDANWVDAYGIKNSIKERAGKIGQLMPMIAGNSEGNNLPVSYPVPYSADDMFMLGKAEWEDETRPAFNNDKPTDAKSTLTQVSFILQCAVTDEFLAHATDAMVYDFVVNKMSRAMVRTQEGCIINGDAETGATGNVNSDDQAPATTFGTAQYHSLKIDHGIRELAINNSNTVNVGAFDSDDINSVVAKMADRYQNDLENIKILANPNTYTKMMTDDALKLAYSTKNPTIDGGVMTPFGMEMKPHLLVPKAEADGKVSKTAGNNTLGQFIVFYAPNIRHGYGIDFKLEVERCQGYGYELTATMQWSFVIVDGANCCAAGINVTL